jgi:SAM-dependent methyltransferase
MSAAAASYVLGSHAGERARLHRQHAIWRDAMLASWDRAGFGPGQRLLDLGCGPGFASLELAERVGAGGQVLAIDNASAYLEHLEEQLRQSQAPQLRTLQHDLALTAAVLHEYVQWNTFALYPDGRQLAVFVERCIQHWRDHGGDPNVAQRLPALLEARGFRLLHSTSLMACSPSDHPKARWLQDFLASYPAQLSAAGRWSAEEPASLWVTPALVELVWERQ